VSAGAAVRTAPVRSTIPALFREQVERAGEAPAVVFDGRVLSYRELGSRVDALAARLAEFGAGPGDTVGVACERSEHLLVAVLAALTAGAAYLPLDVDLPEQRIEYMLDDAKPRCLIASRAFAAARSGIAGRVPAVLVDEEPTPSAVAAPSDRTPTEPHPLDTAYVLYTSGSTGRPKGVAVSHMSIVNHLLWMQDEYGLTPADRVLHKTTVGFDVSVWELLWPLVAGAVLVVAEPGAHREPARLVELINGARVSTVHFVPSMLEPFLDELAATGCPSLRRVLASGEALAPSLRTRFAEVCDARLHNLYGPTEAAIDVTSWDCSLPADPGRVPIGIPVAHTGIHVLDAALRPVPDGVVGELYISGVQLADGYLGRFGLTAERFVACPGGEPGTRMYRTGDLASRNSRGEFEYHGRADAQLKINGVRIEPGEVEEALLRHPAVSRAAVALAETPGGERHLAAFVVPDPDRAAVPAGLVAFGGLPEAERPRVEVLGGRLPVCVLNTSEAQFMYREIFEDRVYARHGITLPENACVLDVGANIGLFTLQAGLSSPGARIYSVEPVPEINALLRRNIALYGLKATVLPCAVGREPADEAEFTFYPNVSLISGLHADAAADSAVVSQVAQRDLAGAASGGAVPQETVAELVRDRLRTRRITVPVRTISQIIDQESITRIDLLKLDVERGELEAVEGIRDGHWELIDQVVVEVHDVEGRLDRIRLLLEARGFEVAADTDEGHLGELRTVYAVRPAVRGRAPRGDAAAPEPLTVDSLAESVLRGAAEFLPAAMVPAKITVVAELPLTANGKLDRAALAGRGEAGPKRRVRGPQTGAQQVLCGLVAQAVGVTEVGIDEDFFRLGGTSMSAVKLTSAISRSFGVQFKLRMVLRDPTVAGISRQLEGLLTAAA
jgi:amino acid adenylation domain-containing protein/FkbM family methyltransferase